MIELYLAGATQRQIAAEFGVTQTTVGANLRRWKVVQRRTGPKRVNTLNEAYFQHIDTEEKAYWLGFLLADGCVRQNSGGSWICCLDLAVKDIDHVKKFAKAIGANFQVKLGHKTRSAYLVVSSVEFCKHLVSHGCIPRKTGVHDLPKISGDLYRHLFRGYIDGDGWFTQSTKKNGAKTRQVGVTGSEKFVVKFQDWLVYELSLKKTKLFKRNAVVVEARYTGNRQVCKIAKLLYAGATIALSRKLELAAEAINGVKYA